MSLPRIATPAAWSAPVAPITFSISPALGRQEEWEQPAGRSESARSATPDFAS